MPLQSTSGAASYDAFGGGAAAKVNYIEDFFQSYLRTGTGASATVTTGLDGSTKETLVWTKSRSAATNHKLTDNVRGATKALSSNTTGAEATDSQGLTAFSATGYTIGTNTDYNNSGATYVDWQWVAQPKFFDVVTYTGNGTAGRTVAHNLGSVPGCIIVKKTSSSSTYGWCVYHRSLTSGSPFNLCLNTTDSQGAIFNGDVYSATDTTFSVSSLADVNQSGQTFVAYVLAHDAGGFGLTGTDNVISCGSVSATGSTLAEVNLGWEPQWLLIKGANINNGWNIIDNMRGFTANNGVAWLIANSSGAEIPISPFNTPGVYLTSTGFKINANESPNNGTGNYIYIAIRRGPMKVPTSGTSVFAPALGTSASTIPTFVTNFPVDLGFYHSRANTADWFLSSRLQGGGTLNTNTTLAEAAPDANYAFDSNTGWGKNFNSDKASSNFRRAPSFFDEVCYTGTGAAMTVPHNLGVAPELIILKSRNNAEGWMVYAAPLGNDKVLYLNSTFEADSAGLRWNDTTPTSSVFSVGKFSGTTPWSSGSGYTYVAYLFASCPGVSKVGSYTGTGTTQQINCGFTAGSRFVLIKRTDSTGDWYVWDSARGIVAGNDSYLLLNSTAAEVTSTDYIDTYSAGFEISSTAPAAINASGGTFLFFAVA